MRLVAQPLAGRGSENGGAQRRSFQGRARPPGDKSMSHRALMFGAVADGETVIDGLLEGADVLHTAAAMAALGAAVEQVGPNRWRVIGRGAQGLASPRAPLDFGNAGTGVRLAMGLIAGHPAFATFIGDQSLSGRPMARILKPLEQMGARWLARDANFLPAALQGSADLRAITYESPTASAQIKSAVLLAGLRAHGETVVIEPHASRDHTERMARAFGAAVESAATSDGRHAARVRGGQPLFGQSVTVPGDPSSAAFPAAAALIAGAGDLLLEDVGLNPLRTGFFEVLQTMGAQIRVLDEEVIAGEPMGLLQIKSTGGLRPAVPDPAKMASMIDEAPILAALAAFAEGETIISGAAELRIKESDRLALMAQGLRACGVDVDERPDGLVVFGRGPGSVRGGAEIETHGDHRIAMSFLVLGLGAQEPVIVRDADMIGTSFPGFASFMAGLGADIRPI